MKNNTMKGMIIVPISGQVISETTLEIDVPYIEAKEVFDMKIIQTLLSQIPRPLRLKNYHLKASCLLLVTTH